MDEVLKELKSDKAFIEKVANRIWKDTDDWEDTLPEPEWIDRMTSIADTYLTRFEVLLRKQQKRLIQATTTIKEVLRMKINDELLQERIDLYLEKHWDEVIADIDNRIAKMFSKIVRELFTTSGWRDEDSTVEKLLKEKITDVTTEVIESTEIDKEEIKRLVKKKIENQVKKTKVDINIH